MLDGTEGKYGGGSSGSGVISSRQPTYWDRARIEELALGARAEVPLPPEVTSDPLSEIIHQVVAGIFGNKRLDPTSIVEAVSWELEPRRAEILAELERTPASVDTLRAGVHRLAVRIFREKVATEPERPRAERYSQGEIAELTSRLVQGKEELLADSEPFQKRFAELIEDPTLAWLHMDRDKDPETLLLANFVLSRVWTAPELTDLHRAAFCLVKIQHMPIAKVQKRLGKMKGATKNDKAQVEQITQLVDETMKLLESTTSEELEKFAQESDFVRDPKPRSQRAPRRKDPLPSVSELVGADLKVQEDIDTTNSGNRVLAEARRTYRLLLAQNGNTRARNELVAELGKFSLKMAARHFIGQLPKTTSEDTRQGWLVEIAQEAALLTVEKLYLIDPRKSSLTTYLGETLKRTAGARVVPESHHQVPLHKGFMKEFIHLVRARPELTADGIFAQLRANRPGLKKDQVGGGKVYNQELIRQVRTGLLSDRRPVRLDHADIEDSPEAALVHTFLKRPELTTEPPELAPDPTHFINLLPPAHAAFLHIVRQAFDEGAEGHNFRPVVADVLGCHRENVRKTFELIRRQLEEPTSAENRSYYLVTSEEKFQAWVEAQGFSDKTVQMVKRYMGLDPETHYVKVMNRWTQALLTDTERADESCVQDTLEILKRASRELIAEGIVVKQYEANTYGAIQKLLYELEDDGAIAMAQHS